MADFIKTISFAGSGNVATHLAAALQKAGCLIKEVFSPHQQNARQFAAQSGCQAVESLQGLNTRVDLLIISVPDASIETVAAALPPFDGIVVHTSGITEMDVLSGRKDYGVFYPLQTFTKGRQLDMTDVPFCVEGSNEEVERQLLQLARKISQSVQSVNSKQRKQLHLAAVVVSNFPNHLYGIAQGFLENHKLDFRLLLPLISETAAKIRNISPVDAQTGPARRNDGPTMEAHLKMLQGSAEFADLYCLFSEQIKKIYHE